MCGESCVTGDGSLKHGLGSREGTGEDCAKGGPHSSLAVNLDTNPVNCAGGEGEVDRVEEHEELLDLVAAVRQIEPKKIYMKKIELFMMKLKNIVKKSTKMK